MFQGLASSITGALSQIRQETQLNDTGIGQSTSHDSGLELQGRSGMDYVVINIMLCPDPAINTIMMLFVTSGDCSIITQCPYYFMSVTRSKYSLQEDSYKSLSDQFRSDDQFGVRIPSFSMSNSSA